MRRLDWLLAPLRAGKRIPKPVLLATAASLAAAGGAFGIALAVVEWRDEGVDLTGVPHFGGCHRADDGGHARHTAGQTVQAWARVTRLMHVC